MAKKIVVNVKEGKIRGIKNKSSFSGAEFYSFYGVPYGQSTSNSARFKDPVKVNPWKNVYDATTQKEGCAQYSLLLHRFLGSEDCLYNNIHTPKLPSTGDSLKAVVVTIHPGGYYYGSPEPWQFGSPNYVMDQDIVYVCVSYRLHILGFLNLDLEECSGNQGLKDIILSLKWIKENLSVFGGDPNNITLLGSSSGAGTVHYLMLSPSSRGLFHKAVVMGMYIFNPTVVYPEENHTVAYEVARDLGYKGTDPNDEQRLLSFLKRVKIEKMVKLRLETYRVQGKATVFPCSSFLATIDRGENAVLPVSPRELLTTKTHIPLIVGICDKEATTAFIRPSKKTTMENFYTVYRQNTIGWGYDIDEDKVDIIRERINSFYLNGCPIETAPMNLKIDILTDAAFSDIYDTLINSVSPDPTSSVFVYKFGFRKSMSAFTHAVKPLLEEPLEGTCHADDYVYWSANELYLHSLDEETTEFIKLFTKLISTFAKTGNPNYQGLDVLWKNSTLENPCYLSIDDPLRVVEGKLNGKRMEFWEDLKKEFQKN